ncbi:peptidylprolyl isomerase [Candidatus Woesearchaeota archaeon]|jgi:FKBP-type peptidyl-prolyl cis-trans isomerase 2|nr:peptidylprolyl isomerase [Candidatus Woesearchaeota archaeon]MBT4322206.1 peptidylprolyl isomerase [Candidatus Woesearchaeota archaeon]MBT4631226.1 peptidylprolyl isomerase [Candidatus Woesearchaeota archaeon]
MAKIKKGDFIELDYTGKLTNDQVFDTSIKEIGEQNKLQKPSYEPLIVCVGEGQVIKGLDKNLESSETEKDYTFEIPMEEAYGKKDPKLMRVVPKSLFTKQKMNPYPGMQINAENMMGIVRSVSGGRVSVDFNHPFAGKDLVFDVKIKKILGNPKEKVQSLLKMLLRLDPSKYELEINADKMIIKSELKLPDVMLNAVKDKISKLVPEINSIEFSEEKSKATTQE